MVVTAYHPGVCSAGLMDRRIDGGGEGLSMETNSTCPDSTCRLRNSLGYCTSTGSCIMVKKKAKIEEKGLTISGYNGIIDRIINRTVQLPNYKRCFELNAWLQGYADCQNAILEIIGQLKDQYGR